MQAMLRIINDLGGKFRCQNTSSVFVHKRFFLLFKYANDQKGDSGLHCTYNRIKFYPSTKRILKVLVNNLVKIYTFYDYVANTKSKSNINNILIFKNVVIVKIKFIRYNFWVFDFYFYCKIFQHMYKKTKKNDYFWT